MRRARIARKYADTVFIQTSRKVGGARNDGIMAAKGDIVATTDADCILPPDWIQIISEDFKDSRLAQLYGPVYPIEEGIGNKIIPPARQHLLPDRLLQPDILLYPWMQHGIPERCLF